MNTPRQRPLSPHIGIYRWSWTMAMSIAHRASGVALYAIIGGVILWIAALADGGQPAAALAAFFTHPVGQVVLFFASWAFWHHLIGGIRHFFWDVGFFFDPGIARNLAAGHFFLAMTINVALAACFWLGFFS